MDTYKAWASAQLSSSDKYMSHRSHSVDTESSMQSSEVTPKRFRRRMTQSGPTCPSDSDDSSEFTNDTIGDKSVMSMSSTVVDGDEPIPGDDAPASRRPPENDFDSVASSTCGHWGAANRPIDVTGFDEASLPSLTALHNTGHILNHVDYGGQSLEESTNADGLSTVRILGVGAARDAFVEEMEVPAAVSSGCDECQASEASRSSCKHSHYEPDDSCCDRRRPSLTVSKEIGPKSLVDESVITLYEFGHVSVIFFTSTIAVSIVTLAILLAILITKQRV